MPFPRAQQASSLAFTLHKTFCADIQAVTLCMIFIESIRRDVVEIRNQQPGAFEANALVTMPFR